MFLCNVNNVHKNVPGTRKLYNLFPLLLSGMDNPTEEDKEQSIDVASDAGALNEVLQNDPKHY